jgi:hypothetical protein
MIVRLRTALLFELLLMYTMSSKRLNVIPSIRLILHIIQVSLKALFITTMERSHNGVLRQARQQLRVSQDKLARSTDEDDRIRSR